MDTISTDVAIIGAGGAGLRAAIALAVRVQAPIYVAEEGMEQAGMMPEQEMSLTEEGAHPEFGDTATEDLGAFQDFVEGLDLDNLLGA